MGFSAVKRRSLGIVGAQSVLGAKRRLYPRAVRAVASRRGNALLRGLARVADGYLALYHNVSYAGRLNGEHRVVEIVAGTHPAHIFDVGANVGNWTLEAASVVPAAHIHAFEIVPSTARDLARKVEDLPMVSVNAYGLGEADGTVRVTHYPDFSEGSGAAGYARDLPSEQIDCRVRSGDDYCQERRIDRVAFVKIDTEGMEGSVLAGLSAMFSQRRVDAVQFEYGRANILTRTLLRDLYEFLVSRGYIVGKIFPTCVEFRPYELTDEQFRGANYLAVLEDQQELVTRLRGS